MHRRLALFLILAVTSAYAGKLPTKEMAGDDNSPRHATTRVAHLEDFRMMHRFGVGFSAGGALAVLGIEADVNLTEQLSISGGLGTGLDYSTFMVKARYFLLGQSVSPYVAASFGRWWTSGTKDKNLSPSVLANKFLGPGYDATNGFSVYMVSPIIGVQFMHTMGFAISAELQYLFKLFDFSNGTYAGLGMHWYF